MEEVIAHLEKLRTKAYTELQSEEAEKMNVTDRQWLIETHYIAGVLIEGLKKEVSKDSD